MSEFVRPTWAHRLGTALLAQPRWVAWALCFAWFAAISMLSSRQGSHEPSHWSMHVLSNSVHAPLFGILAAAMSLLVPREGGWPRIDSRARWSIALAIVAAGWIDEVHQSFVPGRDLSLLDVVTDVVGALATLEIVAALGRPGASVAPRWIAAVCVSFLAGALATFAPRCFPTLTWF